MRTYGSGDISVAEAVAASSAFPPGFAPFALLRDRLGEGEESELTRVTLLTDGGVYDNSGIEALSRHWEEVGRQAGWELTVSSAERAFEPKKEQDDLKWYRLLVNRAVRATDIVMKRVGEYQVRAVKQGSIVVREARLVDQLPDQLLRNDLQLLVRKIRTDLNEFSMAEAQLLVYHGYLGAKQALAPGANVPGLANTPNGMPYVADPAKRWLPFPGDEAMNKIVPEFELRDSHRVKIWSTVRWPLILWLFLLLVLAGSAYAFVWLVPGPMSLSFASVFTGTPVEPSLEYSIHGEIERDALTQKYKRSIYPKDPAANQKMFYAFTKPLGDYSQGRNPGEFQCRVTCANEDCKLEV